LFNWMRQRSERRLNESTEVVANER